MIRFSIFAAVSTEAQAAADKASLSEQEIRCRQSGEGKGWKESAGPYICPGESRTRYVNLRDAELAIPELKAMLDAAQGRAFDVLVMYDFNRLRDLLDPVSRTLSHYGVQVYSVSQPVEPLPPEEYSPYAADSSFMMQGLSRIISQAQISDLRRKYRYAMPRRVAERGLPAITIPFGYCKPPGREADRKAVPVANPVTVPYVIKMKNMLLDGKSIRQIAETLEEDAVRPPHARRWWPQTVRDILRNPFYAGYNRWGVSRSVLDPRTGRRSRDRDIPRKNIIIAKGKHEPLWDDATHQAILAELARRGHSYKGKRSSVFTGLLHCAECDARLWLQGNGPRADPDRLIWRCSRGCHIAITHLEAIAHVAADLTRALQDKDIPLPDADNTLAIQSQAMLDELERQRIRIEDAYQSGSLGLASFSERVAAIDKQMDKVQLELAEAERAGLSRAETLRALGGISGALARLPDFLSRGEPIYVNHLLHALLAKIVISPSREITLQFR
jgi:hypothetical protein